MAKKKKNNKFKRIENYIPESKTLNQKLEELNLEELKEITSIDSRFKRLIIKFIKFLRNEDFTISTEAILKFFELYKDFDVFEIDDMKYTLKMLLCKNKEHYVNFEEYFDMFFYGTIEFKEMESFNNLKELLIEARASDLKKEKEEKEREFEEYQTRIEVKKQEQLKDIQEAKSKIEKEKQEFIEKSNVKDVSDLRRRKEKGEKELNEWLEKNPDELKSLLDEFDLDEDCRNNAFKALSLSEKEMVEMLHESPDEKIKEFRKLLNNIMMENLLGKNNPTINSLCLVASNILMKTKAHLDKKLDEVRLEIRKFDNNINAETNKIKQLEVNLNKESQKKKEEIAKYNEKINNIAKDIEKEIATKHRPVFKEGKNNVKTNLDLLNSDIEKLSDKQYETLTDIIKANTSKFRTKISRAMMKDKSKKFNYKKTMQNSLKTSGIPIELFYEKPKVKKTKIICILDVSGSCAKSSKLLLKFIYELSNVFKGGVQSYAFVKDLADISDFFVNYHIDDAIEESLKAVPRTYSDYYTALKTFNKEYIGEVDKNTIVVFLGDARNNKNEPGTEFLANIQRKAKSTIWLNTEEKPKWNVNDSIIGLYSEYMNNVHEILTTNDIVKFLEEFKLD